MDIQVLSAQYNGNEKSEWQKDTLALEKDKRLHYFNPNYPAIIQSVPEKLVQKFKYHYELTLLKRRVKGNFYDRSSLCKKNLLSSVEKFVKQGYSNIIISVGPFYYSKHLLEIKKTYPQVKLFLDVRDPWTNNKTAFGYWNLTKERFAIEKQAEAEVANGYDKIFTVADDIGEYFKTEYQIAEDKIVTLKNGFDPLDFSEGHANKPSKKVIIFTGNLYEKAEKSFVMLVNQLKKMRRDNDPFFNHYEIQFYGQIHQSFAHYFSPYINLNYNGNIPLAEVFNKIAESEACLLFLTDDLNFSFSTKFYEYLSQKKPIIVFSSPGKTGAFVEEHNLGRQATEDNLLKIVNEIEQNNFYKSNFDISEFEVGNLAKQLMNHLDLREGDVKPEKVLFVAYQFPPAGGPGVQRSIKFVRTLRNCNYEPVVLTIDTEDIKKMGGKMDESLAGLIPAQTQIIRVSSYQSFNLNKVLNTLRVYRLFWYLLYPFFWEKSALWPWRVYKQAKTIVSDNNIRLVYTTSGPFSSLILGYLLKRKLKIKWVADLRDPYTDGYQWSFPSKLHWYTMRRLERFIFSKVDQLIVNTEEVKKLYLKRNLIKADKINVITNGY